MSDDYQPDLNNAHSRASLAAELNARFRRFNEGVTEAELEEERRAEYRQRQLVLQEWEIAHRKRIEEAIAHVHNPVEIRKRWAEKRTCRRPMPTTAGWAHESDSHYRCHCELPEESLERVDPHWETFKRCAFELHLPPRNRVFDW